MIDVVYLCGGSGKRLELGYPKQYARLKGKPLFIYGLQTLNKIKEINNIYITVQSNEISKVYELLTSYNIKNCVITKGGKTRQESVYLGLEKVTSDYVLICEAVRPFMSKNLVEKVINIFSDCVIPISTSVSTVVNTKGKCFKRENIGEVQMPQKYNTKKLLKVYDYFLNEKKDKSKIINVTDDFQLIKKYEMSKILDCMFENENNNEKENLFKNLEIFHGDKFNIKITYPLDLKIAEAVIEEASRE